MSTVSGAVLLFILDWRLTLTILLITPVVVLTLFALGARIRRVSKATQDSLAEAMSVLDETVGGIRIVKAFGHNGYFKTLAGIVHFYNTRDVLPVCPGPYTEAQALAAGCWPEPEVAANMNTAELGDLGLTAAEEAMIVAFLNMLSDGFGQ